MTAALDVRLSDRFTVQGALGAVLGGSLTLGDDRHEVRPGFLASVGAAYRAVDDRGAVPFVLLGASLSFARASTRADSDGATASLSSSDARVSVTIGKTFFELLTPFVVARAFGGPVMWSVRGRDVTGGDRYHYQLGGGLAAHVGAFDAYVEGVPLGEKRLSAGLGVSF